MFTHRLFQTSSSRFSSLRGLWRLRGRKSIDINHSGWTSLCSRLSIWLLNANHKRWWSQKWNVCLSEVPNKVSQKVQTWWNSWVEQAKWINYFIIFSFIGRMSQLEGFGIGCTIIDGDLEIRMIDDISNLTAELQTYLGDVEEILGVLKIHR